jgi:hypothetical protein
VKEARVKNDDHLAGEEHHKLPDFRRNAPDKDPRQYIAEHS